MANATYHKSGFGIFFLSRYLGMQGGPGKELKEEGAKAKDTLDIQVIFLGIKII